MKTWHVLLRIAAIIAAVEFIIMVALEQLPFASLSTLDVVLDPALLIALATPLIYVLTIKPFVVARDRALSDLTRIANTDPLTQLSNRRELEERLATSLAGHRDRTTFGALLLIDLDGFKLVNDRSGHDAGDAVLREVARRLVEASRREDVVSRLGGDEFLVLINWLDPGEDAARAKAQRVAEKLRAIVLEPILFQGESLQVGLSIGVRLFGGGQLDVETAIREADVAMYRAKHERLGGIVFF